MGAAEDRAGTSGELTMARTGIEGDGKQDKMASQWKVGTGWGGGGLE